MSFLSKHRNRKGIAALVAAAALTATLPAAAAFGAAQAAPSVQFQIGSLTAANNNGEVKLANAPYIEKGVAMVPVRALADGLEAQLEWNATDKTIRLERSGLTVSLKAGEDSVVGTYVKKIKLPAKVAIVRGQAFVPAKSVSDLLGADTTWEAKTKKVTVKAKGEEAGVISESFHFNASDEGWQGGFADLPIDYDPAIYELLYAREVLPLKDNKTNYGLKLNGMNRSDDLFMYATKKITGLKPNATYDASLSFTLYTNQAGGMMGVGGAPGEAVSIKAGFVSQEPKIVQEGEEGNVYYKVNVDKGNQSVEGADMKIVGNMVKPDDAVEGFQPKPMKHSATLKANAAGELFVIIGSDSGYEGLTTLYLDDMNVVLTPRS
ncbi:copper amine oxidase N-terminal domain-containing protein [Paenibacillus sp. YIM B09110]|uniref:copper amine oxidase N-terminal domain-containing protein n=1 Tax=Paenibacillus sp. YIM B09110 TaxID=3126102 RepID=UPI00301D764F